MGNRMAPQLRFLPSMSECSRPHPRSFSRFQARLTQISRMRKCPSSFVVAQKYDVDCLYKEVLPDFSQVSWRLTMQRFTSFPVAKDSHCVECSLRQLWMLSVLTILVMLLPLSLMGAFSSHCFEVLMALCLAMIPSSLLA